MGVLHLRVRGPAIFNVDLIQNWQCCQRDLIHLPWQTAYTRALGEFEETLRPGVFGQEFDINGLHSWPPLRVYHLDRCFCGERQRTTPFADRIPSSAATTPRQ